MPDLAQNERQKRTFFTTKQKNRIIMAEERRRQTHREILTKNRKIVHISHSLCIFFEKIGKIHSFFIKFAACKNNKQIVYNPKR